MASNTGDHTPRWECRGCPDDSALLYFKKCGTAEQHAERTGHEVVEVDQ